MAVSVRTCPLWCLGLSPDDEACVRACAGLDYVVEHLAWDALPDGPVGSGGAAHEADFPPLLWLGLSAWQQLASRPQWAQGWEALPRVLVLPADCSREALLAALSGAFQHVICGPLTPEKAHECLRLSLEQRNLLRDMNRMAREILLNRELLTRKSDVLAFMLRFVRDVAADAADAAYASEPEGCEHAFSVFTVLREARVCLADILPVRTVHAALLRTAGDGTRLAELRIDAREGTLVGKDWEDMLVSALGTVQGSLVPEDVPSAFRRTATRMRRLLPDEDEAWSASTAPTKLCPERILLLPLTFPTFARSGNDVGFSGGVLAIELERDCPLGRDQALALDAAVNHLTWLLRQTPSEFPEESFVACTVLSAPHLAANH